MENYWVASYQKPFAIWRINIPFAIDTALQFAEAYEQLATQTQIAEITLENGTQSFKQVTGQSYADYLAECIQEGQTLPFMIPSSRTQPGYYTSLIQYYGKNGLVQAKVANLGNILKALKPDATYHQQYRYMQPVPPLEIWGYVVDLRKKDKPEYLHFSIWLRSDIWFPHVYNWSSTDSKGWKLNQDLAEYHTPRLNQFIEGLHDLVFQFKGEIVVDTSETFLYYREILSDKGINLYAPPPK